MNDPTRLDCRPGGSTFGDRPNGNDPTHPSPGGPGSAILNAGHMVESQPCHSDAQYRASDGHRHYLGIDTGCAVDGSLTKLSSGLAGSVAVGGMMGFHRGLFPPW